MKISLQFLSVHFRITMTFFLFFQRLSKFNALEAFLIKKLRKNVLSKVFEKYFDTNITFDRFVSYLFFCNLFDDSISQKPLVQEF